MKMLSMVLVAATALVVPVSAQAAAEVKYNQELDGFDYPFEVSTYRLKTQNQELKMRYMDVGDQSSTKVIVLLHGKNFSGFYWERIAKDLVKKGYRVIIPDQIGFGKSSKPKAYQYSLGQLALNTKSLLDSLDLKKYDIVGHSMGGMVATTFAVDYPEVLNKLILINPIGLEAYGKYAQFKDTDFFYQNELGKTLDKARAYQQKNYYDGKWSDAYEELLVPTEGQIAGGDWEIVAWNNALTYGPIFSENIVAKFPQITTPTHLVIGTRDKTGPGRGWKKSGVTKTLGEYDKLGKKTQALIKGSKLYELEGLGHMPQFEDYEAFSKVFDEVIAD
ncbi:MAG: alpha/beta fold hydrolase [Akkermansiaceae bacterium]